MAEARESQRSLQTDADICAIRTQMSTHADHAYFYHHNISDTYADWNMAASWRP